MAFARSKKREPLDEAALFEYAVAALARRMRSVRDLRRLMRTHAAEGEAGEQAMDAVVKRLEEVGYLSDARFAADYARLRKENERYGRRRVQQDLAAKGVSAELTATALDKAYEDVDEVTQVRAYIERKRMKQPSGDNARRETARVMNRLIRAGFSSAAIFRVLRQWGVEVEETDVESVEEM